ncbi:carbamoyltransferase HypF [candidate division WOR-3 bacterium]|uniref:Carbamoyltransferase n=1 Tax=candidate division WOR-3 bacterium TaxID=2052148 RepID=A0A9D5K9V6_UNCW3|nr:carbamoyltransferase HypF [candidate division WOR-3 bacterium]MBD3364255.1 carbamoyltransferase HypF [candidate division WOR-3 bacterium]
MKAVRIRVTGTVQGVGFRPWVYRLAEGAGLKGYVLNDLGGVTIHVEGVNIRIDDFLKKLMDSPPPASRITSIKTRDAEPEGYEDFTIEQSGKGQASQSLEVSPDMATCPDCRREILDPSDRRFGYPFTNCTDCGPRYTIISELPYDRPNTVMGEFDMCPRCLGEYDNPRDRRFHAQPNACAVCGPSVVLLNNRGRAVRCSDPLKEAAEYIRRGMIVAVKGLGGYHLMCDAMNVHAVIRLRRRKRRPHKALAIMCRDISKARELACVSELEAAALLSPAAPIILMPWQEEVYGEIRDVIAPLHPGTGIMLAYTPLHHLLFAAGVPGSLVATSANLGDEPIIASEEELLRKLGGVFDAILAHNRKIQNRIDDSVGWITPEKYQVDLSSTPDERKPQSNGGKNRPDWKKAIRLLRRARGFAPTPIETEVDFPPLLAVGAEMKGSFAVAEGRRMWLSPHIGELTSRETIRFFAETLETYLKWFRIKPEAVVCDLHPDYMSSRWAEEYSRQKGIKLIRVQHHHAHIAAVMVEHGLRGPVIGLSLDGTGYGPDGRIWGCELLKVTEGAGIERLGHLRGLPLVGGETAIRRPGLMARGVVAELFGLEGARELFGDEGRRVYDRLRSGIGVIRGVSSAGRLFDTVAGLLGLVEEITFEAQAPIALETLARSVDGAATGYRFDIGEDFILDPAPALSNIIDDLGEVVDKSVISYRFHLGLADAFSEWVYRASAKLGIKVVCCSGGVFANRLLAGLLAGNVRKRGLRILFPRLIPASDGGLASGQLLLAQTLMQFDPNNVQST